MPKKMFVIFGVSNILWMVFAVSQAIKVDMFPDESKIFAQIGDSVSLTCSATGCESPSLSWRTQMDSPLNGKVRNEGTTSTLIMDPVSFEDEHQYLCTVICGAAKLEKAIQVEIYSFSKDPEIHLSSPPEVGKPVTVTCSVPDVYPFERLEIELLKGNHPMKVQDFLEPSEKKAQETKSLDVTFSPTDEDIGTALVCQATLHIYDDDSPPKVRKTTKELEVYKKMFTVEISPGPQIAAQVGDSVMLTCDVRDCESPSFSWRTQIDSPLNGKVRREGSKSTLTLSPVSFENEHFYLCTVICGQKKLEKGIQVELYSFPSDPEIEMSGPLVNGNPVTVSCKVPNVYPSDRLEIELFKGESIMMNKIFLEDVSKKALETKSLEMTFIPTVEDTGNVLVCLAQLPIDEMEFEPKQRQSTQTLYVNVAPRDTTILVSPSSILEEGSSVNMTCSSNGLPAPKILWSRQLSNGDLQPISENATLSFMSTKMEDSGIYVCEGINQAGISRKEVNLTIQVAPKDIQLTAFPSERVKEGDTVIISCICGNVPPTLIILKKKAETGYIVLKSTGGAYTIHRAQLEDAGVYQCESKNEVGSQLRSLTLDVKGRESNKDYFSPEFLVLYCASALILTAIGMIIYFARKANMTGSYSLVEAQRTKV
ncbi:vascular cell adhesion protein 1-like isoform X3 [Bos indicus x Bos taurus]|uniref:vascular cell adhesion protein 1-like isoform X3 n=1 Tax=Bos indicus x Bos taurus TaxID=30522 RepID=UPI000F7D1101|nr:vascular cell adhesion protein 1-like isoform X3 [Bos indicus x Bos taurus]